MACGQRTFGERKSGANILSKINKFIDIFLSLGYNNFNKLEFFEEGAMKRVLAVTKNRYFGQKIRLALGNSAQTFDAVEYQDGFDACFWDKATMGDAPEGEGIISVDFPLSYEEILGVLDCDLKKEALRLEGRICIIRGERIKLSELEARLLWLLIEAGGEYVSREEILGEIWNNEADAGIINVYIHYLREKLEKGEKIILSSRKHGYKIDESFLGGVNNA